MRQAARRAWAATILILTVAGVQAQTPAGSGQSSASPERQDDGSLAEQGWVRIQIKDPYTKDAAVRSLRSAAEWLTAPRCQSVFGEFHDARGLPLTAKLHELNISPSGYLRTIFVLDGGQHPTCRKDGILAFTVRGSPSIFLCGRDFERFARRNPGEAVVTIIHELLHSLGLGERPPAPQEITYRVRQRCSR